MTTDPTITDADRALEREIMNKWPSFSCNDHIAPIIARYREKMAGRVKHCGRCGSDWADNGINSGCPCVVLAERDEAAAKLTEALQGLSDAVDDYCVAILPERLITEPLAQANEAALQALKEHGITLASESAPSES